MSNPPPPITERDRNASGRASRASGMSSGSSGQPKPPPTSSMGSNPPPARSSPAPDLPASVCSMLRTSTEMGSVGGITEEQYVATPFGRRERRAGATSRNSVASSRSNPSSVRMSQLPVSGRSASRQSRENNVPQYEHDALSPTAMNPPYSSPLIPRQGQQSEGFRSRSLTAAQPHGIRPQPSGYSFMSTHSADFVRRPPSQSESPAHYLNRPQRGASPALGDNRAPSQYSNRPRRRDSPAPGDSMAQGPPFRPDHRYGSQNPHISPAFGSSVPPVPRIPPEHSLRARRANQSDPSLGRPEGGYWNGVSSRSRTPVSSAEMGSNMAPPGPPMQYRPSVPGRRGMSQRSQRSHHSNGSVSHQSWQASFSSQSTNQRFESDGPSSDATSPPTPQDSQLAHSFRSLNIHPTTQEKTVTRREEVLYYDGSEAFEVPESGFVHHETRNIRTIVEEQAAHEPIASGGIADIVGQDVVPVAASEAEVAEPPVSSAVSQRLTRDLVKSVLEPVSTTSISDLSQQSAEMTGEDVEKDGEGEETSDAIKEPITLSLYPAQITFDHPSILSQAGSSIMDSSTLQFAVDRVIPIVAGKGMTMATGHDDEPLPDTGPQPPTEDGMSDLLDGYQHTENKTEGGLSNEGHAETDKRAEKRIKHEAKASDEQSFKSCTDFPGGIEEEGPYTIRASLDGAYDDDLPALGMLRKDADVSSFKYIIAPERMISAPAARKTSSEVLGSTVLGLIPQKIRSRPPAGVPSGMNQNWPLVASLDSGEPQISSGRQSSLDPTAKSRSAPLLENNKLKPPVIPPRESSSKPARKKLLRPFLNLRSKTGSDISSQRSENTSPGPVVVQQDGSKIPTPPPMRDRPVSVNIPSAAETEQDAQKSRVVAIRRASKSFREHRGASAVGDAGSIAANASSMGPPLSIQQPSTASPYSKGSFNPRAQSSPAISPEDHEPSLRDGQSTTHLSWPNSRSYIPRPANIKDQQRARNEQEETTTDLARSGYTYHARYQSGFLPDVKEESHEDSSLDTSASNLKRSSVRFDRGASRQNGSADDAVSVRESQAHSQEMSAPEKARALPSLNFTENDLVKDVLLNFRSSKSVEMTVSEEKRELVANDTKPGESAAMVCKDKYRTLFLPLCKGSPEPSPEPAAAEHSVVNRTEANDRQRNLSPDVLQELNDIPIPNTEDLNERLSELLPALKGADEANVSGSVSSGEGLITSALEEIHEVGSVPTNKSSSARLRPLPGSQRLVVVDDEVYENMTGRMVVEGRGQEQHVVVGSGAKEEELVVQGARDLAPTTPTPPTRTPTPALPALPALPAPTRSFPLGEQDSAAQRTSTSSLCSADSSRTTSSTDTRPWNSSHNYPWAKDSLIDIALPSPSNLRPHPETSHRRYGSDASSQTIPTSKDTPSPTPNSISPPPSRGTLSAATRSKTLAHHRRRSTRRNLSRSTDVLPTISETSWPPAQEASVAHVAGERYPTSSLPLPPNLHLPGEDLDDAIYTSDDEPVPTSRRASRSEKKKARRDAKTRLEEQRQSCTDESVDLPARKNRNTFTGVEGMPKVTYVTKNTIKKIKDFGRKIAKKIRNLGRRKGRSSSPRTNIDRKSSLRAPRD